MGKTFEVINHTADVGIIAYGSSINEAFANAARAMFNLITEIDDVDEILLCNVEVNAEDEEGLLVAWLNELIYIFETENMLFKTFDITEIDNTCLKAVACGERIDTARHQFKTAVKAATYHMLKVEQGNGWRVQVLFDI
jgi:SHS2 domain-containing protein